MSNTGKGLDRRKFLQLTGGALTAMQANIAKALAIPANNVTGTIKDVKHVVILMQENRPFDHHFGTIRGVRGFSDPRAVNINLPKKSGPDTAPVSVWLQPAGAENEAMGFSVVPDSGNLKNPKEFVDVLPPWRIDPKSVGKGVQDMGGTWLPGTGHNWGPIHSAWNEGHYDKWATVQGPIAMTYMTRDDVPYHCALADAFTVGDAYFCSVMGPTNPNRDYLWTGCIGNLSNLGPGGTDGHGAPPITHNGPSDKGALFVWTTYPERLEAAKPQVSWKIYQDLPTVGFKDGNFGWSPINKFLGNYGDNTLLYFNQYFTAPMDNPLFKNACTGTEIESMKPSEGAPTKDWRNWAGHLFDQFRDDVKKGTLPQVSWIVAPEGYTEHSDAPMDYGAYYISQVFDILVSNPEVFSQTVFIVNYDEADGSFDHLVPPSPPNTPANGASTVSIENEIITTSTPHGPIGLAQRVPFLVISPWSKGGYVNSQVFDHSSVILFLEKVFGVHEPNISPWRRAVVGDLTSCFNFKNPDDKENANFHLPKTDDFLPPPSELAGHTPDTFIPTRNGVIIGVPEQEKGVRPARALPYELDVHATVNASNHTVSLTFSNTGNATVVFHVRSTNAADPVRYYTVEPGKQLSGVWNVGASYDLSVYGPNGFARYYQGSIGSGAALDVVSGYGRNDRGSITWQITNVAANRAEVSVLDAYSGKSIQQFLQPQQKWIGELSLDKFYGWYDLIITVTGDPTFKYRLAGHVETGDDSISDPVLGGMKLND